jgi:hypothetical protein
MDCFFLRTKVADELQPQALQQINTVPDMREIQLKLKLNDTGKFREQRKYGVPLPGGYAFYSSKALATKFAIQTSDHLTFLYHECSFVFADTVAIYRDIWLMASDEGSVSVGWIEKMDRQLDELRLYLDKIPKGNYTYDPYGKMTRYTRLNAEIVAEIKKKCYVRRHTAHHSKCTSLTYRLTFVRTEIENLKKSAHGRCFTDTP